MGGKRYPMKTLGNGMRMLYPVYRFRKKAKNFFRGGGVYSPILPDPFGEWEVTS